VQPHEGGDAAAQRQWHGGKGRGEKEGDGVGEMKRGWSIYRGEGEEREGERWPA
jgi:hypothetical protein